MPTRIAVAFALLVACAADDDPQTAASTTSDDDASSSADAPATTADPPGTDPPPTDGDALLSWLERGSYTAWAAESDVHRSEGPHGSAGVRTFFDATLADSFAAGNDEHPVGAATVKELYGSDGIVGWAVMVKVEPGSGGARWYWYELVGTTLYADGVDERLCTGCHAGGADQVLTPWPLQ